MRRLTVMEHISLDGVIEIGETPDFPYGDWTAAYRTPAGFNAVAAAQGDRFDLLLGRSTYDIWSEYWPGAESNPIADAFNAATKYVATHRPDTLAWGPAEALGPDVVADVRRIKALPGPDLILWGSSTLTSAIFEHRLVDEVMLVVYPLLLGKGKRMFADIPPCSLELVGSQTMSSGAIIHKYKVLGRLKSE